MIRVVFISTGLSEGGAEVMLYKLLQGIDRKRFEPFIISLMPKETRIGRLIENLGVPIFSLNVRLGQISTSALWRLFRMVRDLKPDVIQGCMYHGNLAASLCAIFLFPKVPVFWNIHHSPNDLKDESRKTALIIRLGRFLACRTAGVIYVSKQGAISHEKLGYPTNKTIIIPNGFDCDELKPADSVRKGLRQALGYGEDNIVIGLVGRYHPMKDHENFFTAAGIISKQHDNVRFLLAGLDVDDTNSEIACYIEKNQVGGRVQLLGVRDDIPDLTASLDIASTSSYSEAFPLVVGEAMACGVPCVVTDVGDSSWIVGDTGVVVPPRDAVALSAGWDRLIKAGKDERARLGQDARKRVVENFSLPAIVKQYQNLYECT